MPFVLYASRTSGQEVINYSTNEDFIESEVERLNREKSNSAPWNYQYFATEYDAMEFIKSLRR